MLVVISRWFYNSFSVFKFVLDNILLDRISFKTSFRSCNMNSPNNEKGTIVVNEAGTRA